MAPSINSVNSQNKALQNSAQVSEYAQAHLLSLMEIAGILRVQPERVQWLTETYAEWLSESTSGDSPQYSHADLASLINAQRLEAEASTHQSDGIAESAPDHVDASQASVQLDSHQRQQSEIRAGYVPSRFDQFRPPTEQISDNGANHAHSIKERTAGDNSLGERGGPEESGNKDRETDRPATLDQSMRQPGTSMENNVKSETEAVTSQNHHAPDLNSASKIGLTAQEQAPIARSTTRTADEMLGEMISTVATSQQSVLNVQDSIREMLNVIAQDNFNLKHENRKLRERMLELERVIAEHQRREETRKEMLESRMRAVEGTLSALQQQLAQLVQLQRQRIRKTWFK